MMATERSRLPFAAVAPVVRRASPLVSTSLSIGRFDLCGKAGSTVLS